MGKRHNTLSDDIFRNSYYIKFIEEQLNVEDFRKEYNEQYNIMLDIYKNLIIINNAMFSDSNDSNNKRMGNVQMALENAISKSADDERNKYSNKTIKDLIDSNARRVYNKFIEWYNNSRYQRYFETLKSEIENEMQRLEDINFDMIVKGNWMYEKNKNSNYKIYINKLGNEYALDNAIRTDFKRDFANAYGIDLSEENMREIAFLYDLVASANNCLSNYLNGSKFDYYNLSEYSADEEFYYAYLKSLHIDIKDNKLFKRNSILFREKFRETGKIQEKLYKKGLAKDGSFNEYICNFDYYYFIFSMTEICNNEIVIKVKNDLINKLINDLKSIFELMSKEENKEENYKKAFALVQVIIERNKNLFERLS